MKTNLRKISVLNIGNNATRQKIARTPLISNVSSQKVSYIKDQDLLLV